MNKVLSLISITMLCFSVGLLAQTNSDRDQNFNLSFGSTPIIFNSIPANSWQYTKTTLQPDGKILVTGYFRNATGNVINGIVRLNTDGSLDSSFNPPVSPAFQQIGINKAIVLANGKILVCGTIVGPGGQSDSRGIIRLNANGSVDQTFSAGTITRSSTAQAATVYDMDVQADGKIIIVGNFTEINGSTVNQILRLNADGSLDNSFNVGLGPNTGTLKVVRVLQSGQILVSGDFANWAGNPFAKRIAALNADGSMFPGFLFDGTGGAGSYYSIVQQQNGGILIAGPSTGVMYTLSRYNSNLTQDFNFNSRTGTYSVRNIAVQNNGKILLVGINDYDGNASPGLVRVNADGTYDSSFNVGSGFGNSLTQPALHATVQQDGKILVSHNAFVYKGESLPDYKFVIRINGDDAGTNTTMLQEDETNIAVYPNPATEILHIDFSGYGLNSGHWEVTLIDMHGRHTRSLTANEPSAKVSLQGLPAGTYLLQLEHASGRVYSRSIIVQ